MIDRTKSNLNITHRKKVKKKKSILISSRKKNNDDKITGANIIFGLDNGATGTISCILKMPDDSIKIFFQKTPAYKCYDYQKDLQQIARIDWKNLKKWFEDILNFVKKNYNNNYKILVVLERPMINADRFKQSKNAARAFEATLIVLEMLNLENNYIIIDSKKWQHYFFGKNTIILDLKESSKTFGIEYLKSFKIKDYENLCKIINLHGDADSLLICRYILEKFLLKELNGKYD